LQTLAICVWRNGNTRFSQTLIVGLELNDVVVCGIAWINTAVALAQIKIELLLNHVCRHQDIWLTYGAPELGNRRIRLTCSQQGASERKDNQPMAHENSSSMTTPSLAILAIKSILSSSRQRP
jgi:hypothetical protein